MLKFRNPSTIAPPQAEYTHAVEAPAGARLLAIAGQVGVDAKGKLADTFEGQAENAFANLQKVLADAGMGFGDVIKTTTYLTDRANLPKMAAIRKKYMGEAKPAATLVIVAGLADPGFLIEVEMTAAKA
jgi:enamine deaminase RidA (YjgF/YER057c/UK114 family)